MMLDSMSVVSELPRTDNGKTNRRLLMESLQADGSQG